MQFDRQVGRYRVINVGSVGMPYGQPGAYWALLGAARQSSVRRAPPVLLVQSDQSRRERPPPVNSQSRIVTSMSGVVIVARARSGSQWARIEVISPSSLTV